MIYAKNNFVGQIRDIIDGYIYEIEKKVTGEIMKIELSMIRSPIGDERGAFDSR